MLQMNQKAKLRTRSKGRLEFRDEDKAWWLARKDSLTSERTSAPTRLPAPTPISEATYALTRRFLFSTAFLFLFLLLLWVLPLTTAKIPPLYPMPRSFLFLNRWLLVVIAVPFFVLYRFPFLQVCWQAREDENWSPTRTTRIKERLKARLFAFLKRKADYAIRGSTISPTLMAGGGMLKTILLEAAFEWGQSS